MARWQQVAEAQARVAAEVHRLMDADAKTTGLKALQGLIWEEGYRAGLLQSHLFDDVVPALKLWHERGIDVRIFSSGSVAAQKAYFRHTPWGDLLSYFGGHYDTTIGPKRVRRLCMHRQGYGPRAREDPFSERCGSRA